MRSDTNNSEAKHKNSKKKDFLAITMKMATRTTMLEGHNQYRSSILQKSMFKFYTEQKILKIK